MGYATTEDRRKIEDVGPWDERDVARTIWQQLERTTDKFGYRPAVTYQLFSGPDDKALTGRSKKPRAPLRHMIS